MTRPTPCIEVPLADRACICGRSPGSEHLHCLVHRLKLSGLQTMDASLRSEFPAVTRWFTTLAHQPNFSAVVGEVKLCEVPRKFTCELSRHPSTTRATNQFFNQMNLHCPSSTNSCICDQSVCQVHGWGRCNTTGGGGGGGVPTDFVCSYWPKLAFWEAGP